MFATYIIAAIGKWLFNKLINEKMAVIAAILVIVFILFMAIYCLLFVWPLDMLWRIIKQFRLFLLANQLSECTGLLSFGIIGLILKG
jgi:hypothetical protein